MTNTRVFFFGYLFLVFGLGTLVFSCIDYIPKENNILVKSGEFSQEFTVSMSLSAKKPDVVDFFYIQDSLNESFTEDKKLRFRIKGNGIKEEVEFVVRDGNVLKFRLDLGRNISQEGILIRAIEIQNKGKILHIPGHLLQYFFNENKFMSFSDTAYVNFSPAPRRVPFMTSSALLNKKMKIEL